MILTRLEFRLMKLEEHIARLVCSVNGVVTKEESDELDRLRIAAGRQYDAIEQGWAPLEGGGAR